MKYRCVSRGLLLGVVLLGAFSALSLLTMALWNWLMPTLFSRPAISFWQAAGLLLLAKIILGGLRFRRRRGLWRTRLRYKWQAMTPEQRQALRQGIRHCRGWSNDAAPGWSGRVAKEL